MHTDPASPARPYIDHLTAALSLQAGSRRNALQAVRLLRARQAEQREADDAVRDHGGTEAFMPAPARELEPVSAQLPAGR